MIGTDIYEGSKFVSHRSLFFLQVVIAFSAMVLTISIVAPLTLFVVFRDWEDEP